MSYEASWTPKRLVKTERSMLYSSQKSRPRTKLLVRVGRQIRGFEYPCKLKMRPGERILLTNEKRKLVPEKIWEGNDQQWWMLETAQCPLQATIIPLGSRLIGGSHHFFPAFSA